MQSSIGKDATIECAETLPARWELAWPPRELHLNASAYRFVLHDLNFKFSTRSHLRTPTGRGSRIGRRSPNVICQGYLLLFLKHPEKSTSGNGGCSAAGLEPACSTLGSTNKTLRQISSASTQPCDSRNYGKVATRMAPRLWTTDCIIISFWLGLTSLGVASHDAQKLRPAP